ncbi:MAG: class I SAM-dependent methyltransferase [Bacteroidales bacterium]|nr:class I SAM-dependent methyltransferase [Bacteroidales bacterium]
MFNINQKIEDYILSHSDEEDEILKELYRQTYLKALNPRMISGYMQGKFLEFISKMIEPEQILEIGTFTGYSAICLAKGLKPSGKLHTIELNIELEEFPKKYVEKLNLTHKIKFYMGDALQIIDKMDYVFDLVFIDGDKRQYCDYYNKVFDKVKKGGFIIADNIFWDGKVLDENDYEKTTMGLKEFSKIVKSDKRVEKFILPLRDGLMLIRKH